MVLSSGRVLSLLIIAILRVFRRARARWLPPLAIVRPLPLPSSHPRQAIIRVCPDPWGNQASEEDIGLIRLPASWSATGAAASTIDFDTMLSTTFDQGDDEIPGTAAAAAAILKESRDAARPGSRGRVSPSASPHLSGHRGRMSRSGSLDRISATGSDDVLNRRNSVRSTGSANSRRQDQQLSVLRSAAATAQRSSRDPSGAGTSRRASVQLPHSPDEEDSAPEPQQRPVSARPASAAAGRARPRAATAAARDARQHVTSRFGTVVAPDAVAAQLQRQGVAALEASALAGAILGPAGGTGGEARGSAHAVAAAIEAASATAAAQAAAAAAAQSTAAWRRGLSHGASRGGGMSPQRDSHGHATRPTTAPYQASHGGAGGASARPSSSLPTASPRGSVANGAPHGGYSARAPRPLEAEGSPRWPGGGHSAFSRAYAGMMPYSPAHSMVADGDGFGYMSFTGAEPVTYISPATLVHERPQAHSSPSRLAIVHAAGLAAAVAPHVSAVPLHDYVAAAALPLPEAATHALADAIDTAATLPAAFVIASTVPQRPQAPSTLALRTAAAAATSPPDPSPRPGVPDVTGKVRPLSPASAPPATPPSAGAPATPGRFRFGGGVAVPSSPGVSFPPLAAARGSMMTTATSPHAPGDAQSSWSATADATHPSPIASPSMVAAIALSRSPIYSRPATATPSSRSLTTPSLAAHRPSSPSRSRDGATTPLVAADHGAPLMTVGDIAVVNAATTAASAAASAASALHRLPPAACALRDAVPPRGPPEHDDLFALTGRGVHGHVIAQLICGDGPIPPIGAPPTRAAAAATAAAAGARHAAAAAAAPGTRGIAAEAAAAALNAAAARPQSSPAVRRAVLPVPPPPPGNPIDIPPPLEIDTPPPPLPERKPEDARLAAGTRFVEVMASSVVLRLGDVPVVGPLKGQRRGRRL